MSKIGSYKCPFECGKGPYKAPHRIEIHLVEKHGFKTRIEARAYIEEYKRLEEEQRKLALEPKTKCPWCGDEVPRSTYADHIFDVHYVKAGETEDGRPLWTGPYPIKPSE